MANRAVVADGQVWTVREIALTPAAAELAAKKGNPTNWLSFVSYVEKRRIVPIPAGWQDWSWAKHELASREYLYRERPAIRMDPAGFAGVSVTSNPTLPPFR